MEVIKAAVFDPAMLEQGGEKMPVRLEMVVTDWDGAKPSYIDSGAWGLAVHYGPLLKIYLDDDAEDEQDSEDPDALAAQFNTLGVFTEPVFPVTVSANGGFWGVFYMRVSRLQKIMREHVMSYLHGDNPGVSDVHYGKWELVPDPSYTKHNQVAYYLQHSLHITPRSMRAAVQEHGSGVLEMIPSQAVLRGIVETGTPREIWPHRMMDMTEREWAEESRRRAAKRAGSR